MSCSVRPCSFPVATPEVHPEEHRSSVCFPVCFARTEISAVETPRPIYPLARRGSPESQPGLGCYKEVCRPDPRAGLPATTRLCFPGVKARSGWALRPPRRRRWPRLSPAASTRTGNTQVQRPRLRTQRPAGGCPPLLKSAHSMAARCRLRFDRVFLTADDGKRPSERLFAARRSPL